MCNGVRRVVLCSIKGKNIDRKLDIPLSDRFRPAIIDVRYLVVCISVQLRKDQGSTRVDECREQQRSKSSSFVCMCMQNP